MEHTTRLPRLNTVAEVVREYLDRCPPKQSQRAYAERRGILTKFVGDKGNLLVADCIPDDLEGWIETHPKWKSGWTLLRISNTVKRPFNWARRKGLIWRNPFESVGYSPGERGRPMDDKHFVALLRGTDPVFRRVLLFMSLTGARPCEVSDLEWSFLDCDQGTATLYVHKTAGSRKDREPRIVYLSTLAVRLLIWIRRQGHSDRFVFTNSRGGAWTTHALDFRMWNLREKTGIPRNVKLYGLRHAWATTLAVNGTDLETLAALLGHTSIEMARHYVHIAGRTAYLRDALERGLG